MTPEGPKQSVTFKVKGFEQSTEPMNSPRRAPQATILDDAEGGTALTDLYVFDGTTQLAHQVNTDPDFGEVVLELSHGNHNLSFVCTRSSGLSYNAGKLSCTSLKSTFGKLLALNVTSSTEAQTVQLTRIHSLLEITIEDAFPTGADRIEFNINTRRTTLDVTTLCGTDPDEFSQGVSCAAKVGLTNVHYSFAMLCSSLTDEELVDMTINVYETGGSLMRSVTITDIRLASNTKTLLSGELFSGTGASITVNTTWNQSIVGSF